MPSDLPSKADLAFRRYLLKPRRRRLARVVDAHYRFVWDTALRVTGNAADAADIAQDVFLKLLLHPPRPEQVSSPRGFLAWEVLGRAASIRRSAERRRTREQAAAGRAAADGITSADLDELRARVAELPDDLRGAVELRYFAGLRNAEIAALTGVGERHVEKRLERARDLLRSRIGPVASLLVLLDKLAVDGGASAPPAFEPPPGLHAELLRIAARGEALAVPVTQVVATAGGSTLAKTGLTALAVAAVLLLVGSITAVFLSSRSGQDDRVRAAIVPAKPTSSPPLAVGPAAAADATAPAAAPAATSAAKRYGSIRGSVSNEDGERVAGARVVISAVSTEEEAEALRAQGFADVKAGRIEREVLTDEAGEFSFADVPPVRVRVDVEKSPYLLNWIGAARIKPGEESKLDLVLSLPLRLRGTVRTPEGDAVKGAEVFISFDYAKHFFADPTQPEPEIYHAFAANDEGLFDTGVGIVNIHYFCSLPGYVTAPGREAKEFEVSCRDFKEQEAQLDLVLAPERRLAVLVLDSAGAPVKGAAVTSGSIPIEQRALTDAAGRAELQELPAGRASVTVSKDGFQSESIDPTALETPEVRVVLQPHGAGIEGRITFDDDVPAAAREVTELGFYELDARDKTVRYIREVRFDDKKNSFTHHPRGPLRFEVVCELGWRTLSRKPLVYDGRSKLEVELRVDLEPPYIRGRVVRAATRETIPAARVTLHLPWRDREADASWGSCDFLNGIPFPRLPGNKAETTTGADGSFLFFLSATDRYRTDTPQRRRAIFTAGTDEMGYSADAALDIDIAGDTVVKDIELEVHGFGAIEGHVDDEEGRPLPGAAVAAYDGQWMVRHARADATGAYRIDGLRPGRYLVEFLGHEPYVKMGGGFGGDADGLPAPSEFFERPATVEEGKTARRDVDLRTDALGTIDGVVPSEFRGAAGADCALVIGGRPRGGLVFEREGEVREGRFRLERLLPGTYRVWLCGDGPARIAEADVIVKRGPSTRLVMAAPSGALVIPVEGASPDVIARARVLDVIRREPHRSAGNPVSTELGAAQVTIAGGRIRLHGLLNGSVDAGILVPGYQAARSEPAWVADGMEAVAPAVVLAPGRRVRVRLELDEGLRLPGEPTFRVIDPRTGADVPVLASREGEEPVWELSGLPDGAFQVVLDAGSALVAAPVEVVTGPEKAADTTVSIHRRSE